PRTRRARLRRALPTRTASPRRSRANGSKCACASAWSGSTTTTPPRLRFDRADGEGDPNVVCKRSRLRAKRSSRNDVLRGHNGAGVVRHIDVESGVHLRIGVIRRRVFYHRDLVAELSGKSNGRFDAGMCDESDDDELVDAVILELQIQIRVGEAAGTPMLRG